MLVERLKEDQARVGRMELRTKAPRTGWFFVAILLGPVGIVYVMGLPWGIWWGWGMLAAAVLGLAAIGACVGQWYVRYFVSPQGLERRRFGGWDRVDWMEVEAVGRRVVRERYRFVGVIVSVYTRRGAFRPFLAPEPAGRLLRQLRQKCAGAVWMDEDTGKLEVRGDSAVTKEVVQRHRARLLRHHRVRAIALLAVLIPLAAAVVRGRLVQTPWPMVAISVGVYGLASWRHWRAIWRLRARG